MKAWALTKTTYGSHSDSTYTKVMAVYGDWDALLARIDKIAAANPQYPLERTGNRTWRIGPDEDEGFFGNRRVDLAALETDFFQ